MRERPALAIAPWRRARHVLGINARNLLFVHRLNERRHFPLADDKVLTKQILSSRGVPVTRTLAVLSNLIEVSGCRELLETAGEFVIKPSRGRQGTGIVVIAGRDGDCFRRAGGERLAWDDLRSAMADILFGVHGVGRPDRVLIEERVRPTAALRSMAAFGLPDIRVILLDGEPAMSMMRVPTRGSAGRANLHQGAVGVALRLSDGAAYRAVMRGSPIDRHPDTREPLTGFALPRWDEVIEAARQAAATLPLPYLGVDLVLAEGDGPLVMEVNVRPGLEIQNVTGRGLRRVLRALSARTARDRAERGPL